ncbi:MAG TPA: autotransporter outer membrane beta-barrel domain-containing protein, partial [Devosiaceae bacterium]|nr:autotransporter outer membrane beta-barrel domain-containing protein [Devosiaceae bacterium]
INAGGNGILVLNGFGTNLAASGGGGTIKNDVDGVIHATGNGIQVGGLNISPSVAHPIELALGLPNGSLSNAPIPGGGSFDITNDGQIGTNSGRVGGAGITALVTGDLTVKNGGGSIYSTKDGVGFGLTVAGVPVPTLGKATVTNDGTGVIDALGNGVFGTAIGDVQVTNNTGGKITAGLDGVNVVSDTGAMNVVHGGTVTAGGSGIVATSFLKNTIISGDAGNTAWGSVNATNGPGVVGISVAGTSTVDAGKVTSGSGSFSVDGVSVPSFNLPVLGTVNFGSGGVLSLAMGDATANAHGDITTTGTFGVLAFSATGNATAHSDAGITIDPAIGMSGITFGAGQAAVPNNATINSTVIGLLGVNIGNGSVNITNSNTGDVEASTGAGVVALKLGAGGANTVDGTNDVVVSNDNTGHPLGTGGGIINAPDGVGVFVLALDPTLANPNNVLVSNTNNASITGAGGFLSPAIGVLADGNVGIDNLNYSQVTNTGGTSGFAALGLAGGNIVTNNDNHSAMTGNIDVASLGGNATVNNDHHSSWDFSGLSAIGSVTGDAALNNDRGSQIHGTDSLLALAAGNNASIKNDRGADLELSGLSANLMLAGNDASILNNRGGSFTIDGLAGGNFMVAGHDASITNTRGGRFTMDSLLNANVMIATNNATILNDHHGHFSLDGFASGNFMFAGNDASITNDRGSSTSFNNLVGANLMVANTGNASITNDRGGSFEMFGLANGNFMSAGTNASILNDRGGSFEMTGVVDANVMLADGAASITNTRGGSFSLDGFSGGNFMSAGTDATITNTRGGSFSLTNLLNGNLMVAQDNAAIVNDRHGSFTLDGISGNVMAAITGNASISNDHNSVINLIGVSGTLMAANQDATIDNNNGATINLLGNNNLGFLTGGTSTLNNNSTINVGGLSGGPGVARFLGLDTFNNAGQLNMLNNVIGDFTYTSHNYVGGGVGGPGLLSVDVNLDGLGGSSSDLLWIDGQASGTTLIAVNNLHVGPATYDPVGTKLVYADTTASGPAGTEFALQNGPIDSGLYTYDLSYFFSSNDPSWWLTSAPNARAFELAALPSQIQNMDWALDSTWHDRTADLRDDAATGTATGGAWVKVLGQHTGRDYDQSFTDNNGTFTNTGHSDQKIGGVTGGVDTVLHTHDMDVALGVMGSYMASSTAFTNTGTQVDISGTGVGAYATAMRGGFFLDAVGRVQFLGVNYATAAPWADMASSNARSYTAVVDAGYRTDIGPATIEPLATIAYNRTTLDDFALLGNNVSVDDASSLRGRLGVRVTGKVDTQGTTIKPFAEANVWSQWMGDNTATLSGGATGVTLHDNTGGLSGELKGGVEVFNGAGLSGFLSGLVRGGVSATTYGAQAGVRSSF